MMRTIATLSILSALALGAISSVASAQDRAGWRCWLSVFPTAPNRLVQWDGSVPAQWDMTYKGQSGRFFINSIGQPGRVDYVFAIQVGNTTLLSSSQAKGLTDYNLVWHSDTNPQDAISMACYTNGALE